MLTGRRWGLGGVAVVTCVAMILGSCQSAKRIVGSKEAKGKMDIQVESFGSTAEGQQVRLYTLTNAKGSRRAS